MSTWIRNPEGRIIAIEKERLDQHPLKKRPGKTSGGIILVAALLIAIGLILVWPSNDPAALPVSTQTGVEDRLVSGVAGQVGDEEYLFALTADGAELLRPSLAVFTLDDSGRLQRTTSLSAPVDELRDDLPAAPGIAFADSTAYVPLAGTDRSALWIVDLSDPEAPRELATVELETEPGSVAVSGNLVAVGPMDGAIVRFFDTSDLAQPQALGDYRNRIVSPTALAFVNDTLFVTNRDGVTAVDVSLVEAPREVGSWSNENWWRGIPMRLHEVTPNATLAGNHLYAAADVWGVEVLDIGNPEDITRPTRSLSVTQLPQSGANIDDAVDVAATGDTLYALWRGDATDEAPVRWVYTIQQIDVSDPGDPQVVSETNDLVGYSALQSLVVGESHLYFLNRDWIHVVNTAGETP